MADRGEQLGKNSARGNGQTVLRDKESDMDESMPIDDRGYNEPAPSQPAEPRRGFFDLYKPGQGYYTRVWTGAAFGILVCWGAQWLFTKLEVFDSRLLQVCAAVGVILGFGLLGYWALGLNRRVCDFLIATEGEMKKVNWTSRKEIIGSTKVVIFVVFAMSLLLFVVDLFFMAFFSGIGVLKGPGFFQTIRNMFGG